MAIEDDLGPPMSIKDATVIARLVEQRLRLHLPHLTRKESEGRIILTNPTNMQSVILFDTFKPETHGAFGYRVWTVEAIPELLRHLVQTLTKVNGD